MENRKVPTVKETNDSILEYNKGLEDSDSIMKFFKKREKRRQERVIIIDSMFTKSGLVLMYVAKENNFTYISQIARGIFASCRHVDRLVSDFEKLGVLKTERLGNARKVEIAAEYLDYVDLLSILWKMKRKLAGIII